MLDAKKIFRTRMTHKIFSASRNICFLYLVACLVAIGNLSFQQNFVYAYETSTTSSSTYHHHHNTESNNVESSLIPITASEKQPLPSLVMNASNDVNNNTNAKINNQNISELSSSSPSLSAADAIQVNADFNNDGRDDLAIGAQDEDVGSIVDAGAVNVIYGSASGLSTTAVRSDQFWTQNTPNVEDDAETSDNFGRSLSTGDFNNDGFADLVIGVSHEDVGSPAIVDAGAVHVIYGSASGLSATAVKPDQFWTQNTPNVEDDAETLDRFGTALSTGDFNNDPFDDLAIGVNAEDIEVGNIANAGTVQIIYGSASGLSATAVKPDQKFQQGAGGLDDMPEQPDNFGFSLAAGDFNNDTFDDLAVGAPNEGITAGFEGIIQVIYGSSSGLSTSAVLADQKFQQGAGGLDGIPHFLDTFGSSLAAGDFNNDRRDDLAVGTPAENAFGFIDAGIVQVIYGSSSGLSTSAVLPDQTFILADGGSPGENDLYGLTLSAGDFTREGGDDLAVGAPNKQLSSSPGAGIVHVLYGSSSGLGNNFVFANHILAQGINGLDDIIEPGDEFAGTLSSADFNGDRVADLAVGVPGEDVSGISNAGAVNVIYGNRFSGLVPIFDQFWTQKIHNEMQRDNAESGDGMGGIL
jgi:FG-GAP repeat